MNKEYVPEYYPHACPGCGTNLEEQGVILVYDYLDFSVGHIEASTEDGVGLALDKIGEESSLELQCSRCGSDLKKLSREVKEIYLDPECEFEGDENED